MGHCVSCMESTPSDQMNSKKRRTKKHGKGGLGIVHSPAKLSLSRKKHSKWFSVYWIDGKNIIGKENFKMLKMIGKGAYGKVYLVEKVNPSLDVHGSLIE